MYCRELFFVQLDFFFGGGGVSSFLWVCLLFVWLFCGAFCFVLGLFFPFVLLVFLGKYYALFSSEI